MNPVVIIAIIFIVIVLGLIVITFLMSRTFSKRCALCNNPIVETGESCVQILTVFYHTSCFDALRQSTALSKVAQHPKNEESLHDRVLRLQSGAEIVAFVVTPDERLLRPVWKIVSVSSEAEGAYLQYLDEHNQLQLAFIAKDAPEHDTGLVDFCFPEDFEN